MSSNNAAGSNDPSGASNSKKGDDAAHSSTSHFCGLWKPNWPFSMSTYRSFYSAHDPNLVANARRHPQVQPDPIKESSGAGAQGHGTGS